MLENGKHGPELCLGVVGFSLPPQCDGVPLPGWDWGAVDGEIRRSGTTWGTYRVVGTYDGRSFTVTEPPGTPRNRSPEPSLTPPHPTPSGGWKPRDASTATAENFYAIAESVRLEPDFGGVWLYDPVPPSEEPQDFTNVVLNVAFSGDLKRHEDEIRKTWGGALCVVRHEHTLADLERIRDEAVALAKNRNLSLLSWGPDEFEERVKMTVVFASEDDQNAMDARFGTGLVVLTRAIKPVA